MRYVTKAVLGLGIAASLAACQGLKQKHEEKEPVSASEKAANERASAASETADAAQKFEESKADYIKKAEADLNQLEAKIAAFKAEAPTDQKDVEAHKAMTGSLEQNLTDSRTKLQQLQNATIDDWDAQQRNLEQSILTTRAAYDAAVARTAH